MERNETAVNPIGHAIKTGCQSLITDMETRRAFRAAATEYLFPDLNVDLVREADMAAGETFHHTNIPRENIITVHVR